MHVSVELIYYSSRLPRVPGQYVVVYMYPFSDTQHTFYKFFVNVLTSFAQLSGAS